MADKPIGELPAASAFAQSDLLVTEQGGVAKSVTGQVLMRDLAKMLDGHGGIKDISLAKSEGLVDTYEITTADGTVFSYTVKNGKDGAQGAPGPSGTPRNWVDNSDFGSAVNQRGQSQYAHMAGAYGIDRWILVTSASTMTKQESGGWSCQGTFMQYLSEQAKTRLYGRKVTVAISDAYGMRCLASGNFNDGFSGNTSGVTIDLTPETVSFNTGIGSLSYPKIRLYDGEYTAETLPEYQHKGYAAELMECRRYYIAPDAVSVDVEILPDGEAVATSVSGTVEKMNIALGIPDRKLGAVLYTKQTLTEEQKAQARENILDAYMEETGVGAVQNAPSANNGIWAQWNSRLAFGMEPAGAPVPFKVDGQMLVDGTIIAHNNAGLQRNRWGFHVFEAYSKDNYSRMTMLLDKHNAEASGKPSLELYYYTGASHHATAYGNTKIGSDVKYHSFCFDRDKMTAYGEIDAKMPVTLAKISLSNDIDSTYKTVEEADAVYEPESSPEANNKCLKFIALNNAENGAMFYDIDRDKPVMKVNGIWCDIPFTPIEDPSYDVFNGIALLRWRQGHYDSQYLVENQNANRISTVDFVDDSITLATALDGYMVGIACFADDGSFVGLMSDYNYVANSYSFGTSAALVNEKVMKKAWNLSVARSLGYKVRLVMSKEDYSSNIDPAEGINIVLSTEAQNEWESGTIFPEGYTADNSARIRKITGVDDAVTSVVAGNGYQVLAAVYDGKKTFGHWNVSSGALGSTEYTQSIDLAPIRNAGYKHIHIVAKRTDNGNISPSEGANITFA